MKRLNLCFFLVIISVIWCCDSEKKASTILSGSDKIIHFKGREIDLKPYVEGFPFHTFRPFYASGKLYYMKTDSMTVMMELDLSENPDLEKGHVISDIDYAARNVWNIRYNKRDKHIYWTGDEINDEVINLTRLNPETGVVEKLTDVLYIFGYGWNSYQTKIAYVARLGDKENRLGELRIFDLEANTDEAIVQDVPELRFTWGSPSWRPDGNGIVVTALKNADRMYGNMVYVDLNSKQQLTLTDLSVSKGNYPLKEWISNDEFLFLSNEDGFYNLYLYNLKELSSMQLTHFNTDISESEVITIDAEKYLLAITSNPLEDKIYLFDLKGNKILEQASEYALSVYDVYENRIMVSATSNTSLFRIDEITVDVAAGIQFNTLVDVPHELKDKIYHAAPEKVSYPTFDFDPNSGVHRMIHAYLYTPKNPLPKEEQMVMIQSFYGGGNNFSKQYQILADAGIYVLSPSPRGSSGFGKEFYDMNNKDLGGNEIIDIIYAAKYVSEKLGIPPERVGVFGGSHGGYATMRTLTFPGEINGNKASFDWGFGLSHAGFSDIIHFYEHCNIPDWVTLEAGDPKTESDKLKNRSPLYHADKMVGKLLLTHGTNDSRVPIEGSRMMADSLNKYNKEVTLVEFEGQGHHIKGLDNTITYYKSWFDFLETVVSDL